MKNQAMQWMTMWMCVSVLWLWLQLWVWASWAELYVPDRTGEDTGGTASSDSLARARVLRQIANTQIITQPAKTHLSHYYTNYSLINIQSTLFLIYTLPPFWWQNNSHSQCRCRRPSSKPKILKRRRRRRFTIFGQNQDRLFFFCLSTWINHKYQFTENKILQFKLWQLIFVPIILIT